MRSKMMNIAAHVGDYVVLLALTLLVLIPALYSVANADHRSTAVLPALSPVASTTEARQDATAEGADVLPVSYHDAPAELWNALRAAMPHAYLDGPSGIGTFSVPVGSAVFFEQGMFLATLDGFMVCIHGETTAVCSPTGPVIPTTIPTRTANEVYDYMTGGTLATLGTMTEGAEQRIADVAHVTNQPRRDRSDGWRPGKIRAEDGSLVPPSFYDRVTTTGATQARCDYLGKKRVPDARYGHRCA